MRTITANFFISLDGVVDSPQEWHFDYHDDEMQAAIDAGVADSDAFLMGRVLYDAWSGYWPSSDLEFADAINSRTKYVLSNTLETAEWENSEIISGDDVASQIADLKAGPGGNISMSGSTRTTRWLLDAGLLDELHLLVHPVVVGGGKERLFAEDSPKHPLELISSETFGSGVLHLVYAPAKTARS
jgi:dihydrofolate reductase